MLGKAWDTGKSLVKPLTGKLASGWDMLKNGAMKVGKFVGENHEAIGSVLTGVGNIIGNLRDSPLKQKLQEANNAAQTIRRTASYYKYLLPTETKELNPDDEKKVIKNDYINLQKQLTEGDKNKNTKKQIETSLISLVNNKNPEYKEILPLSVIASQIRIMEEKEQPHVTVMGGDGQPYDFSQGKNSWNFEFDEIPFQEFTEVQVINTWTPYYLCVKLKPLMLKSPFPDKYIVNVTAVEGIFNHYKRTTHVHTNMAKAALNMFTLTCGKYLKNDGIYMTCVDTGWVSPMNEMNKILDENEKKNYEKEFENIPLDELDGAMRVLHPVIEGVKNKNYLYGILLKDYTKSNW